MPLSFKGKFPSAIYYDWNSVQKVMYHNRLVWSAKYKPGTKFMNAGSDNPFHFAIDKAKVGSSFTLSIQHGHLEATVNGVDTVYQKFSFPGVAFPKDLHTMYAKKITIDNTELDFTIWWNNSKDFIIRIDTDMSLDNFKQPISVTIE